jgi:hypothetical protein
LRPVAINPRPDRPGGRNAPTRRAIGAAPLLLDRRPNREPIEENVMSNAIRWGSRFYLDPDAGATSGSAIAGLTTGKLASTVTLRPIGHGVEAYGQIIGAGGGHESDAFRLNPTANADQENAVVAGLSNGGFVTAWQDWSSGAPSPVAQVFDSEGHPLGASFVLGSMGDWRVLPQLAARPDGGFVATWQTYHSGTLDIEGVVRAFNADGSAIGDGFVIPGAEHPELAVLADGRIVSAWGGPDGGLHARIFGLTGAPAGEEFVIGVRGGSPDVKLAALQDGGFAAVWATPENAEDTDIHAQIFNASGGKVGGEILVNTTTDLSQSAPQIAQLADGRLAIAWIDTSLRNDIKLQLINLDGTKSGDELLVNQTLPSVGSMPDITTFGDGRFVVSWHDDESGVGYEGAQIFDARESAVHLTGTPFNDEYYGTAFDDSMKGLAGDDWFDGGGGIDTVEYTNVDRSQYQIIDLGNHIEVRGPEGTDTLYNVEYLKFGSTLVWVGSTPEPTPTPTPPAEPPPPPPEPYVSGLFDTRYYLAHYGDVSAAKVSAIDHFNSFGWHEGRDPNAFFDTTMYLAANKGVAASGVNPLTDYHQSGWQAGRDPGPGFDVELYRAHNPDVAAAGVDPLEHYLQHGMVEGRPIYAAIGHAVNGFDAEWYVFHNPDVAAAGVDPLTHYLQNGWHEGRNPNAWFDTKGYLAHYADVAAAGINPLQHYEQFGWHEGRDPSAGFDTLGYLAANGDVAAAHSNPLDHFINNGIYEGRVAINDGVWH